jgi:class 3 adenylate cyclase
MTRLEDLTKTTEEIFNTTWDVRDGNVIPESEDLALKDGAVKIEASFLYADLAGSSQLAKLCPWETTAKIIRAYLDCCVRLIKIHNGEIRSFDGDRVMGIFKGTTPNTNATNCAREIDWMVEYVINPKAKERFKSVRDNNLKIKHCVGVDFGTSHAVRAGIRNSNDLIWIGEAPSFAAKLSDLRNYPYAVYITKTSFNKLPDASKKSGNDNIWEERTFEFADEVRTIYRTKYPQKP